MSGLLRVALAAEIVELDDAVEFVKVMMSYAPWYKTRVEAFVWWHSFYETHTHLRRNSSPTDTVRTALHSRGILRYWEETGLEPDVDALLCCAFHWRRFERDMDWGF